MTDLLLNFSVFIREVVSQAGYSPATVLNEEQFEEVFNYVQRELMRTEKEVEEKDRKLKQLYSFDRFI